jgi:hypothetical protein
MLSFALFSLSHLSTDMLLEKYFKRRAQYLLLKVKQKGVMVIYVCIYLFIYVLISDAVNISDCAAFNVRMIGF